ncbi:MAG: lamin tail domain-containing protein, partial [Pirellulales bacterium]
MLAANVLITEIMYHPTHGLNQPEDERQEFIELYNAEPAAVDLSGWRITRGVDFTIPEGRTIGAGQYLAIAADPLRFAQLYPSVTNVVGGWTGRLSNTGEDVELEDATGDRASLVSYRDEGDWSLRRPEANIFSGFDGWTWFSEHDGGGRSLELINRAVSNDNGQNWAASLAAGGTPGALNSRNSTNIAPLILDVAHAPIVPTSTQQVHVTARLTDEAASGFAGTVHYRVSVASPGPFLEQPMFDDGLHGDGVAGDGVYGATLPAQGNDTAVEFYVRAVDSASNVRTWPGPTDASGTQGANAYYQVDNTVVSTSQPYYRLILSQPELTTFSQIEGSNPGSDALMNTTFVSTIGGVTEAVYQAEVRIRGQGSRGGTPKNYRVNFPHDQPWRGLRAINLNTQFVRNQLMAMTMFDVAGLAAERGQAVQVRRNNVNLADLNTARTNGAYVQLEVTNEDWAEDHFPGDGDGNSYRGQNGTLSYSSNINNYVNSYLKRTNESRADWTDIQELTRALDASQTPDASFIATLEQHANVQQWLRWMAVNELLVNEENGIINGFSGDDYGMYRGVTDPRFTFVPHDMDNVLGGGDQGASSPSRALLEPRANLQLRRILDFQVAGTQYYRPWYWAHLRQLAQTVFAPANFNPLIDQILGGWVPAGTIDAMKTFNTQRVAYVLGQIPGGTPTLTNPQDSVRITEVMYNPASGEQYEFIELRNVGAQAVDLSGLRLNGAVRFTFPDISLAPGEYIVVAEDEAAFVSRYGNVPRIAGQYTGDLNNMSERIVLEANDFYVRTVLDFTYADTWQPTTDGGGYSLVIIDQNGAPGSWNSAVGWRASLAEGGSPGGDDLNLPPQGTIVINEALASTTGVNGDRIELRNTSGTALNLGGYYLSDDASNRVKYRIPDNTMAPGNGYLVLNQATHFGFNLSDVGTEIYLTAPNRVATIDSIDFLPSETDVAFGR